MRTLFVSDDNLQMQAMSMFRKFSPFSRRNDYKSSATTTPFTRCHHPQAGSTLSMNWNLLSTFLFHYWINKLLQQSAVELRCLSLAGRIDRQTDIAALTIKECLLRKRIINGFNLSKRQAQVYKRQFSLCYLVCVYLLFAATLCTTETSASSKWEWRRKIRRRVLSTNANKVICPPVGRSRKDNLPQVSSKKALAYPVLFSSRFIQATCCSVGCIGCAESDVRIIRTMDVKGSDLGLLSAH
jgi:hypothetical protein